MVLSVFPEFPKCAKGGVYEVPNALISLHQVRQGSIPAMGGGVAITYSLERIRPPGAFAGCRGLVLTMSSCTIKLQAGVGLGEFVGAGNNFAGVSDRIGKHLSRVRSSPLLKVPSPDRPRSGAGGLGVNFIRNV